MGLAQLNNKTWPQPKDVPSLASHLASQNASIDWARIHEWVQVRADLPDENPPEGVEASHWGIDRALYGLVKNRRATLASLEEVSLHLSMSIKRGTSSNHGVRLSEKSLRVQAAMRTPPKRTKTLLAPPPLRIPPCRRMMRRIAHLPLARLTQRPPNTLHVPGESTAASMALLAQAGLEPPMGIIVPRAPLKSALRHRLRPQSPACRFTPFNPGLAKYVIKPNNFTSGSLTNARGRSSTPSRRVKVLGIC